MDKRAELTEFLRIPSISSDPARRPAMQEAARWVAARLSFANKIEVTPDRMFVGLDAYQKVIDSGVDVVLLTTPPGFRPLHIKAAIKIVGFGFRTQPPNTADTAKSLGRI